MFTKYEFNEKVKKRIKLYLEKTYNIKSKKDFDNMSPDDEGNIDYDSIVKECIMDELNYGDNIYYLSILKELSFYEWDNNNNFSIEDVANEALTKYLDEYLDDIIVKLYK